MAEPTSVASLAGERIGMTGTPELNNDTDKVAVINSNGTINYVSKSSLISGGDQDLNSVLSNGNVSATPIDINNGAEQTELNAQGLTYSGPDGETTVSFQQPESPTQIYFPKNVTATLAVQINGQGANEEGEITLDVTGSQDLQDVTDNGSTTTNDITVQKTNGSVILTEFDEQAAVRVTASGDDTAILRPNSLLLTDNDGNSISLSAGDTNELYVNGNKMASANGYVPYSGATGNLDLGDNQLYANFINARYDDEDRVLLEGAETYGAITVLGTTEDKNISISGLEGSIKIGTKEVVRSVSVNSGTQVLADANGNVNLTLNTGVQVTGTAITFTEQKIYNTSSLPATGNITEDLTNAKLGIVQKIYHNNGTAPTFPSGWVLLGTNTYITGVLNIIYAEWCGGTRVEYWITQEA